MEKGENGSAVPYQPGDLLKNIDIPGAEKAAKEDIVAQKEEEVDRSTSTLHIDDPFDYAGRSFTHIPQDIGKNL